MIEKVSLFVGLCILSAVIVVPIAVLIVVRIMRRAATRQHKTDARSDPWAWAGDGILGFLIRRIYSRSSLILVGVVGWMVLAVIVGGNVIPRLYRTEEDPTSFMLTLSNNFFGVAAIVTAISIIVASRRMRNDGLIAINRFIKIYPGLAFAFGAVLVFASAVFIIGSSQSRV